MQELSARRLWVCPLWDVEYAAGPDVPACGAACSPPERGRPLQRRSAHWQLASLAGAAVTYHFYGSAPPRDSCCSHFGLLTSCCMACPNAEDNLSKLNSFPAFFRSVMRLSSTSLNCLLLLHCQDLSRYRYPCALLLVPRHAQLASCSLLTPFQSLYLPSRGKRPVCHHSARSARLSRQAQAPLPAMGTWIHWN